MSTTLWVISKTVIYFPDTHAQCENSLLLVWQKPQQGYEHEKAKGVAPIVIKLFWLGNRKLSGLSIGRRKTIYVQMQSTQMFCIIGKVLFVAKITATEPVVCKRALLRQTFQRASRMPCMPVGVLEGRSDADAVSLGKERRGEERRGGGHYRPISISRISE